MKRLLQLGVLALALTGCDEMPKDTRATHPTSNPAFKSQVLFTDKDGYTMRSWGIDGHSGGYYVTPGPARTIYTVPNGKTRRTVTVDTAGAR